MWPIFSSRGRQRGAGRSVSALRWARVARSSSGNFLAESFAARAPRWCWAVCSWLGGASMCSALLVRAMFRALADIHVNATVCVFTFGLAIVSTLVFGLVPALQVSRPNVSDALQQGSKGSTRRSPWHTCPRLPRRLAGFAFAPASRRRGIAHQELLQFARDQSRLRSVASARARAGRAAIELSRAGSTASLLRSTLPEAWRTIPGVEAVGGANPLPFSGNDNYSSFYHRRPAADRAR